MPPWLRSTLTTFVDRLIAVMSTTSRSTTRYARDPVNGGKVEESTTDIVVAVELAGCDNVVEDCARAWMAWP